MQKDKILSMLGLARRAGRLSMGHDAVIGSVRAKKAKLVLVCAEISQGTKEDIEFTVNKFLRTHRLRLQILQSARFIPLAATKQAWLR